MIRSALAIAAILASMPAMAAEKLFWGPKADMYGTVVSKSGLNTDHAKIVMRLSPAATGITPTINSVLKANCRLKQFSSFYGEGVATVKGKNPPWNGYAKYIIMNEDGTQIPDAAFEREFDTFKALCHGGKLKPIR